MATRVLGFAVMCGGITLAFAAPASAATLMGSDLSGTPVNQDNNDLSTHVQTQQRTGSTVSHTAPVGGVLVEMKLKHDFVSIFPTGPQFKDFSFRILTRNGSTLDFASRPAHPTGSAAATMRLTASTPAQTSSYKPKDASNDPIGVPIQAGEYLAVVGPANSFFSWWANAATGARAVTSGDHSSGSLTYFEVTNSEALIQGVIEPDADGDKYGDETQDACPSDPSNHKTACTDVSMSQSASPNPATVGGDLTYTLTAKNEGSNTATNVNVADSIPGGADFVSASSSQGSCSGPGSVSCSIGNLAPGASAVATIVVRPTAPGTLANTGTVTSDVDPNASNNSATTTTTVNVAGGLGGAGAAGSLDDVIPVFASARIVRKRFAVNSRGPAETPVTAGARRAPKGTSFIYTLSENARVVFTIERVLPGRRVGNRCRRPTRANRSGQKCKRYKLLGRFAQDGVAGQNTKPWSGKIGRKKAAPGTYRATLVAKDGAGNASQPKRIGFRVVRR